MSLLLLLVLAQAPPAHVPAERVSGLLGVSNVGRITPGLYRGNAPNEQGVASLKALGIRTVVNLRHYHGATEEQRVRAAGLEYVHIILASSDTPSDADVHRFLEIATDPRRQPVYFHCWRGRDRTGAMCAAYRMAIDGWSLAEARAEMESYGFWKGWHDLSRFVDAFPPRAALFRPVGLEAR